MLTVGINLWMPILGGILCVFPIFEIPVTTGNNNNLQDIST